MCCSLSVQVEEEDTGRSRATVKDLLDSITALSLHYEAGILYNTPSLLYLYNTPPIPGLTIEV